MRSGTFAFYSLALTPYKLDIIGVTPSLGMRESEILTYLSDNDFDNYVVFDDNFPECFLFYIPRKFFILHF